MKKTVIAMIVGALLVPASAMAAAPAKEGVSKHAQGKGALHKGKAKGGLHKGKAKGDLHKGGLRKGKGGLHKGKAKGGLHKAAAKGHGKGAVHKPATEKAPQ